MALTVGHTGVVVRDLPLMRRFYGEILGLAETRHVIREGPFIDGITGLTGVVLEAFILGTAEHPNAVELLKYRNHPSAIVPKGPNGHGMNHIHFIVDDLDPILAALEAEGLDHWGAPQDWPERMVARGLRQGSRAQRARVHRAAACLNPASGSRSNPLIGGRLPVRSHPLPESGRGLPPKVALAWNPGRPAEAQPESGV